MLDPIWLIDWSRYFESFSPIGTRLLQLNFWSVWLSLVLVAVVALFHLFRGFKAGHDIRRFSLLVAVTFIPVVMVVWSEVPASVQSKYPLFFPWLWNGVPERVEGFPITVDAGLIVETPTQNLVLIGYLAWLVFYPLLWLQAIRRRRILMRSVRTIGEIPAWSLPRTYQLQEEDWIQRRRKIFNYLKIEMSVRRPIKVFEAGDSAPFTFGWLRPVLVLPHPLREQRRGIIGEEEFRCIVAHEFAHIKYHNLLHSYHHVVTWFFFPALFPVLLFKLLRSKLAPSDRTSGRELCFVSPARDFQLLSSCGRVPALVIRCFRSLFGFFAGFPEFIELMTHDFELHADAAAVREGRVDEKVLKKTLALAILHRQTAGQADPKLERLRHRIEEILLEGYEVVQTFLDRLLGLRPNFIRNEARFLDLGPDAKSRVGGSLFLALSIMVFASGIPVALLSPLFGILEPFQTFAQNPSPKPEEPRIEAAAPSFLVQNNKVPSQGQRVPFTAGRHQPTAPLISSVPGTVTQGRFSVVETDGQRQFAAANQAQTAMRESMRQLNESEARRRSAEISSQQTRQQEISRQINAANDLQRRSQENLLRQSQQTERMRQQMDQANANQRFVESQNRFQIQQQASERMWPMNESSQKALREQSVLSQNMQAIERNNNRALAHQRLENQMLRQQAQSQNIQAVNNTALAITKLNDQLVAIQKASPPPAAIPNGPDIARLNNQARQQIVLHDVVRQAQTIAANSANNSHMAVLPSSPAPAVTQPRIPNPPPAQNYAPPVTSYQPTHLPSVSSLPRTYDAPKTFTHPQTYVPTHTPPVPTYTPRPVSTFNPPRSYTPPINTYTPPVSSYTPPRTFTQTYTPPIQTYTPPVSTFTPPRIHTPPPMPTFHR